MCMGGDLAEVIVTRDFNDSHLKSLHADMYDLTVKTKGAM